MLGANWDGRLGDPGADDSGASDRADVSAAGDGSVTGDGATTDGAFEGGFALPRAVGLGALHGCVIDAAGVLRCWGDNAFSQAGGAGPGFDDSATVVDIHEPALAVAAGFAFTCALGASGDVYSWGDNASGQLGRALVPPKTYERTPGRVEGLTKAVVDLAARSTYACVVDVGGTVACWGGGAGLPTSDRPAPISGLSAKSIRVAVGTGHACALGADGTVACWGSNGRRQLGVLTPETSTTPIAVALPGPAIDLAVGRAHTCALVVPAGRDPSQGGSVLCWGDDTYGQLADGDGDDRDAVPFAVPALVDARAIAAGDDHTCALTTSGAVRCWGDGSSGKLGTAASDAGVVEVFGLANPRAIGAGKHHSCATIDGGAMCWGANDHGQLGNGDTSLDGPSPRPVAGW